MTIALAIIAGWLLLGWLGSFLMVQIGDEEPEWFHVWFTILGPGALFSAVIYTAESSGIFDRPVPPALFLAKRQ